jgi:beta-glucanase (GH16 family)
MGRIIFVVFFIFVFAINADAQSQYQFEDEFNGSSVDTTLWALYNGYLQNGNNEKQYYQPANATESGGYLTITAENANPPVDGYDYTSAYVYMNTFNFLYGTVEVRALMPGGVGPWPAIWLLGADCQANAGGPACNWPYPGSDEIDIAEILNSNLTQINNEVAMISNGKIVQPFCNSNGNFGTSGARPTITNVSQNWHVYTLIWEPGSLTWQVDGVTTCYETTLVPSDPMFLIINTAVGGAGEDRAVQNGTLPQTMLVDYVHVTTDSIPIYQVSPSAGANGSISPSSVVTVNPGSTTTFTVTPNPGYYASVGGTCGGTLSGSTYTTGDIIAPCSVTASFSTTNPVPRATVPYAPTDVTATAGSGQATVSFKLPANGGSPITGYNVTSSPGGITASRAGSPITVNGLTNGTAYTFTVTATNATGTSQASTLSNSVTPEAPRRHSRR